MFIEEFFTSVESNTREYAVATSILAFAYHVVGNKQKEMEARISSAIADIRAVVKENYSLCALGNYFMEWAIWNVLITISRLVWKMLIIILLGCVVRRIPRCFRS